MNKHPQELMALSIGLTLADLSVKLKVCDKTIYRYFRGQKKNMDALKTKCMNICIDQAIKRRVWEININYKKSQNGNR